jgi:hypothetical protein
LNSALLLAVVVALALPTLAGAVPAFRTPERKAYCAITEGEPPPGLVCWRPRDGMSLYMLPRGSAKRSINPRDRGLHGVARVLRFGHAYRAWGYVCVSRRSGLTCTNRVVHGWWLGRDRGVRVF